jgi:hypothetical protein
MEARDAPEPLDGIREVLERRSSLLARFTHRLLEDGDQQVVLVPEVQVDGAGGDPRGPRDVGHLRVEVPLARDHPGGRLQDGVSFRGSIGVERSRLGSTRFDGVRPGSTGFDRVRRGGGRSGHMNERSFIVPRPACRCQEATVF